MDSEMTICHLVFTSYTTETDQVISRRGLDENGCEMYKNEKRTCKVCKSAVYSMLNVQIWVVLVAVVA